jgi:hypothetical protein
MVLGHSNPNPSTSPCTAGVCQAADAGAAGQRASGVTGRRRCAGAAGGRGLAVQLSGPAPGLQAPCSQCMRQRRPCASCASARTDSSAAGWRRPRRAARCRWRCCGRLLAWWPSSVSPRCLLCRWVRSGWGRGGVGWGGVGWGGSSGAPLPACLLCPDPGPATGSQLGPLLVRCPAAPPPAPKCPAASPLHPSPRLTPPPRSHTRTTSRA